MKKVLVLLGTALAIIFVFLAGAGADSMRRSFGMSADSLAGEGGYYKQGLMRDEEPPAPPMAMAAPEPEAPMEMAERRSAHAKASKKMKMPSGSVGGLG